MRSLDDAALQKKRERQNFRKRKMSYQQVLRELPGEGRVEGITDLGQTQSGEHLRCFSKQECEELIQVAKAECDQLLREAKQRSKQLITEAQQEGNWLREEYHQQNERTLFAAKNEAARLRSEASHEGERSREEVRQQCERMIFVAKNEVTRMLNDASEQAHDIARDSQSEYAKGIQRRSSLRANIVRLESRLNTLIRRERVCVEAVSSQECTDDVDADSMNNFRARDAARKKDAYWRKRGCFGNHDSQQASTSGEVARENDSSGLPNRKRRCVDGLVTQVIRDLFAKMKDYNTAAKNLVFQRFWLHSSVRKFQPVVHGCPQMDASVGAAVSDLKETLKIVKVAKRKDHLSTKRALLTALVGQSTVENRYQSSLAKALGIKRQNLYRAARKRKLIDLDPSTRYPMGERAVRCDKISDAVRKIVEHFWETNTRISPCKKDSARFRVGVKMYEEHRVHWLEDTEVEFFMKFRDWCISENNGVSIGLRSFQHLKPYYIRTMKDRMVCCCKEHVQMDMLKEAVNRFRKHHHQKDCVCECSICRQPDAPAGSTCVASKTFFTSVRGWMEGALCPRKEGQQWHSKECLMGRCTLCGVDKLDWCRMELDPTDNQLVDWQTFQYVELEETAQMKREKKKGTGESAAKKVKRLRLVSKRTSFLEFKNVVLSTMPTFIVHNFRARWQSEQFRLCLKTFPRGTIVSSIDFSENYTFKVQNEIQTQHWDNRQITLLIHVTYRHREDVSMLDAAVGRSVRMGEDADGGRDIVADYHFYISDDNNHDTLFVQYCMNAHWHWMKKEGISVDQHWVWSDGAASQFKACRPFYYVSRYFKTFGARMQWFFHASGHGKGVADALGGHVKSALEKEQLRHSQGRPMENAADAIAFCKEKFALGLEKEYGDVQLVRRFFWEIPVGSVNRDKKWDCDPIKGTRSLHCFDGFSPSLSTILRVRELCCFCPHCVDDESDKCENREWTGPFKIQMVTGVLPANVRSDIEDMGVGQGGGDYTDGSLADLVQLGDFYAVEADVPNKWNVDFYICQCEQVLHTVNEPFNDGYDVAFEKGDRVLKGRWFQPVPGRESKFCFNDRAPSSYTHGHSVVHIRFGLTPCNAGQGRKGGAQVYSLHTDTLAAITDSLSA